MKKILLLVPLILLMLVGVSHALTINFAWDRNTETDLNHYTMYFCNTSSICTIGNRTAVAGTGTCVGNIPQPATGTTVVCTLSFPLPAGTEKDYYFAVTASDNLNNESGNSNIVTTRGDNVAPGIPGVLRTTGVTNP